MQLINRKVFPQMNVKAFKSFMIKVCTKRFIHVEVALSAFYKYTNKVYTVSFSLQSLHYFNFSAFELKQTRQK